MWREPFSADPDYITAPMPKTLWIELTSRCPFDCIFCTRKVRFGAGQHLDFEVFTRLMDDLDRPDFIGLNYSGESIYYPRLLEAIRLARSTGAYTELVTAFSTISEPLLRGIVESGLDRLAVSLHTMDPDQYQRIYRFGSLDLLKRRVDDFLALRDAVGARKPRLEFCFVALNENLDQLAAVAAYAKQVGVPEIFVHPIIGRHLVPHDFSNELSANQLRDGFRKKLRSTVASVRHAYPDLPITVLNADVEGRTELSREPRYYAPALPSGARIHGCDQSPFESVHVLASGNVVVCEVHDEVSLGNLHEQSLREIWNGERYRKFRRRYAADPPPECRTCVWKLAYAPEAWRSAIVVRKGMSPQLLRGWHAHEGAAAIWSRRESLLALRCGGNARKVRIAGVLPPGPDGRENILRVVCNRLPAGEIVNATSAMMPFDTSVALPAAADYLYVDFSVAHLFRPALHGASHDGRDLGFALERAEAHR